MTGKVTSAMIECTGNLMLVVEASEIEGNAGPLCTDRPILYQEQRLVQLAECHIALQKIAKLVT